MACHGICGVAEVQIDLRLLRELNRLRQSAGEDEVYVHIFGNQPGSLQTKDGTFVRHVFGKPDDAILSEISKMGGKIALTAAKAGDCKKREKRTVACVNFCRNLPTEWLQRHEADLFAEDGTTRQWGNLSDIPDFLGLIPVRAPRRE